MDSEVDHYLVLGLPSGEEGAELSEKEMTKAYRVKALELHPDKKPDDPNAQENFHKLRASYEILKDEKLRKALDDRLRAKREQQRRYMSRDVKRRKMMSDLEERERAAFAPDPSALARKEERIARKLREEVAAIRAGAAAPPSKEETAAREPHIPTDFPSFQRPVEADRFDNPAGAGYQAFEDSVMKKLQQAAQRKK